MTDKVYAKEQAVKTHKANNPEPLPSWLCIFTQEQRKEWLRGVYRDNKPFDWMKR